MRLTDLPLDEDDALQLSACRPNQAPELIHAAGRFRDNVYGRRITFSPKVFLPITNLCRNVCGYC